MKERAPVRASIQKIADQESQQAHDAYYRQLDACRLLDMRREVSVAALSREVGQPDFDRNLQKLLEDLDKQFEVTRAHLMKARAEFEEMMRRKLGYRPWKPKPAKTLNFGRALAGATLMQHAGGTPECALVDESLTFLSARYHDNGFFDVVEPLPNAATATSVRAKVDGSNGVTRLVSAWGLEITPDFLTDHCDLALGGDARMSGLVHINHGGSVSINLNTTVAVFRLPQTTLQQLIPGTNSIVPDYWFSTWSFFSSDPYVDTAVGLHSIPVLEDWLDVQFLANGMFASGPGTNVALAAPNYLLQAGDKIIIQVDVDIVAHASSVLLHLNDVGTLFMRAYMMHRKWH